ncbi:MAG TPA: hypothetical protein VN030_02425 [Cellvibrio sp.]|nr:hypothetical protein [Cellvibrio sp.]
MSKTLNIANQNTEIEQLTQTKTSKARNIQATKIRRTLAQEFQNFLADAERLFASLTSLSGSELEAAKAEFSERLTAAKNAAEEIGESLAQQTREKLAATDAYVHEQPWKAIGAGTAVGLLLGLALARRN